MTTKLTVQPDAPRVEAALVYPDGCTPGRWLVGAPDKDHTVQEAFSGPNACRNAIEFAHRRYGSARVFAN